MIFANNDAFRFLYNYDTDKRNMKYIVVGSSKVAELSSKVAGLNSKVAELSSKVAELSSKVASPP